MKEAFTHSRAAHEKTTLIPARRKSRVEISVCAAFLVAFVINYLNVSYFHWW